SVLQRLGLGARQGAIRVVDEAPISHYRAGDEVVIGIEENAVVRGSVLVYLVPLLGLFAGALLAQSNGAAEPWIVFAAVSGLGAGFAVTGWLARRTQGDPAFVPRLLGRAVDAPGVVSEIRVKEWYPYDSSTAMVADGGGSVVAGLAIRSNGPVARLHRSGGRGVSGGSEYQHPTECARPRRRDGPHDPRTRRLAADLPGVLRTQHSRWLALCSPASGPVPGLGIHHFQGRLRPDQQPRGEWSGRDFRASVRPPRTGGKAGGCRSASGPGPAQDRCRRRPPGGTHGQVRRPEDRRVGAGHWLALRLRVLGYRRDRQCQGSQPAQRELRALHPDRCGDQPRQLRRSAVQPQG